MLKNSVNKWKSLKYCRLNTTSNRSPLCRRVNSGEVPHRERGRSRSRIRTEPSDDRSREKLSSCHDNDEVHFSRGWRLLRRLSVSAASSPLLSLSRPKEKCTRRSKTSGKPLTLRGNWSIIWELISTASSRDWRTSSGEWWRKYTLGVKDFSSGW